MVTKFLRIPEILGRRGGGHSKLYSDIAAGTWPPIVKFGRASVQPEHEVDAMLAAVAAGASDDELRRLVEELVRERARKAQLTSRAALSSSTPASPAQ